jgi:ZIP family zinc transporter/zinc and cadmium transporter
MILKILCFGIIVALAEVLGGVVLVYRRRWTQRTQEILLALGAGFILALVFLNLIPASYDALGPSAALYMLIGFSILHFFEHTVVGHLHFGEETHTHVMVSRVASLSAVAGLFIHAFFDGFSISIGMQFNFLLGLLIFIAVLLHKIPEGLTIASIMMSASYPRRKVLVAIFGIGLATIVGIVGALLVSNIDAKFTGIALAISSGTIVYVGASDLIPEINKSRDRIPPLVVFGGIVLYYFSERFLEGLVR